MRILHTVQRYFPQTGGSEEVVRQLSEHLVRCGHEVTVATGACPQRRAHTIAGVRIAEFELRGNAVDGIRGDADRFQRFVRAGDFDIVMNYAAQIWSTDLCFPLIGALRAKTVLVPCGYSALDNPRFGTYFERLPDILRRYDAVVHLSPNYRDAHFAAAHGLTNGRVIPNGADPAEFAPSLRGRFRRAHGIGERPLLLHVSNHSLLKNHAFFWAAAARLGGLGVQPVLVASAYSGFPKKWLSECYPACRLHGLAGHGLVLEDLPRPQVAEAFVDADAFVFGSRLECSPLVLFEAFASRTLFVSTACGNVADHADVAVIVRDAREAAAVVRDFLRDRGAYAERLERGYERVRRGLNWHHIARQYLDLYTELLAN